MAKRRAHVDPSSLGKSVGKISHARLLDSNYRKHYMLYRVRASIAVALKSLRETRCMTQKQLAKKAGIPQSQIARLESLDDDRIPGLDQLVRIFSALGSRAFIEIIPRAHADKKEIVLV